MKLVKQLVDKFAKRDAPKQGDIVDGFAVESIGKQKRVRHGQCLTETTAYCAGGVERNCESLVSLGKNRWRSTGRYGCDNDQAEMIGQNGLWDLFLSWERGGPVLYAIGKERADTDVQILQVNYTEGMTPEGPLALALDAAKSLNRLL